MASTMTIPPPSPQQRRRSMGDINDVETIEENVIPSGISVGQSRDSSNNICSHRQKSSYRRYNIYGSESPSPSKRSNKKYAPFTSRSLDSCSGDKKNSSDHSPALIQKLFSGFLKQETNCNDSYSNISNVDQIDVDVYAEDKKANLQLVESSHDICMLMDGIRQDLTVLWKFRWSKHIQTSIVGADHEVVPEEILSSNDTFSSINKAEKITNSKSCSHSTGDTIDGNNCLSHDTLQLLAARLSRVKYLLYKERSSSPSSSPDSSSNNFFRNHFPFYNNATDHDDGIDCDENNNFHSKTFSTNAGFVLDSLIQTQSSPYSRENVDVTSAADTSNQIPCFFLLLLEKISDIPFEGRKAVAYIFNYLLVCGCIDYDTNYCMDNGIIVTDVDGANMSKAGDRKTHDDNQLLMEYATTMVKFVSFIKKHFDQIMIPIVLGHRIEIEDTNKHPSSSLMLPDNTATSHDVSSSYMKTPDIALHYGSMLRSILRHPALYSMFVSQDYVHFAYPIFELVNQANFEISSDALETLRTITTGCPSHGVDGYCAAVVHSDVMNTTNVDLVTRRKVSSEMETSSPLVIMTNPIEIENMMWSIASSFLERDYQTVFEERFNINLLSSQNANYITRRVGLQILSTILLTRSNYNVMMRYISSRTNLRTIMILLRDPGAQITLEAFHVFKIFVVNPNKAPEVCRILFDNRIKLVKYLSGLHQELELNDEQFRDEKQLVISTLEGLEAVFQNARINV